MKTPLEISIPQAAVWLLRIAVDPALARALRTDPVAFAAWYAAIGDTINWPQAVIGLQKSERAKRLSLERMLKVLSQVNYTFAGRINAAQARLVLEGYAIHDWVTRNAEEFTALAAQTYGAISAMDAPGSALEALSPFAVRVAELGRVINLSPLERDILSFAFLTTISNELSSIFEQLADDRWRARVLWTVLFNTTTEELAKAMRPRSPLRLSGLLQTTGRRTELARVPSFWVEVLAGSDSLIDALLEPLNDEVGSGRPARLLDEDLALAVRLLKNATEPGVNLLLYGDVTLDKRQLLQEVVAGSARTPWRMRRFDDASREVLPSLTFVAFQLLAAQDSPALLVIQRPSEVLQTARSDFFNRLFGIEIGEEECLPFDENLLATNPVPALWLTSNIAGLPDDTVARFVFHAPLKRAARDVQEAAVRKRLQKMRLGKAAVEQIMKLDGISGAQLESAVRASRLINPGTKAARDHALVQALRRSQRALARELAPAYMPSVTAYSLEYLNTSGRFSPQQILDSFRRRPKGSVLLYGPPGTGKTQFTEYLAAELKLPLVSKSASALLSKWLGDSEKNIAAAFEQAAAEDAVLFFDEGDSFLRGRERARHSWEVTQTNELLQRMERFEGIVIVATNLFRDLDVAALRRFTFKIEFRELDASQRWRMFLAEAGLAAAATGIDAETREKWEHRLLLMPHLTPGDFATVKRQCLVLDTCLTPGEWLDQLEIECQIKSALPRIESSHGAA
ncbi:MAG: AAA family ATPase [Proteobacteria bacterium]|nr:AAA family ATPase [Pseudomonadota bacterium]